MQFSIPIIIIKGGIIPLSIVILNPIKSIVPITQITPIVTIIRGKITALNERK
jgi:hypothetical protein